MAEPLTEEQLVAELRAARAREAELRAVVETWQARCSADQDNMTRFRRRAIAAEAERDELRARIEATLQLLATKFSWCFGRQVILIDKVRTALSRDEG